MMRETILEYAERLAHINACIRPFPLILLVPHVPTHHLFLSLSGLAAVVPVAWLSLFTWRELSARVCGSLEVDLDMLQRHTEYAAEFVVASSSASSASSPSSSAAAAPAGGKSPAVQYAPVIDHFWAALRSFSHAERRRFLQFARAQERMPASDAEFTQGTVLHVTECECE
jgi:hypothetical protein